MGLIVTAYSRFETLLMRESFNLSLKTEDLRKFETLLTTKYEIWVSLLLLTPDLRLFEIPIRYPKMSKFQLWASLAIIYPKFFESTQSRTILDYSEHSPEDKSYFLHPGQPKIRS